MSEEAKAQEKGLEIVHVSVQELKDSEYNPRTATNDEYLNLRRSIEKFNIVDPIIANSAENRKNIVIGGHFRLRVAKDLGKTTVPVVYINIPDLKVEQELNLRLNNNTGHNDLDLLMNIDNEVLKESGLSFDDIIKTENEIPTLEDVVFEDAYEPNWVVIRFDATLTPQVLKAVEPLKALTGVKVDVAKQS